MKIKEYMWWLVVLILIVLGFAITSHGQLHLLDTPQAVSATDSLNYQIADGKMAQTKTVPYPKNGEQLTALKTMLIDQTGTIQWIRYFAVEASQFLTAEGVTQAQNGDIYVLGNVIIEGKAQSLLIRYSSNGDLLYSVYYNGIMKLDEVLTKR